jgi:hypothetical protein
MEHSIDNDNLIEINETDENLVQNDTAKSQESKLDMTETAGSYWRYFFKPANPSQTKIKCRLCTKEASRGEDQSTSGLLSHMKHHHRNFHVQLKEARDAEKAAKAAKPPSIKPINLQKEKCTPEMTQTTLHNYQVLF